MNKTADKEGSGGAAGDASGGSAGSVSAGGSAGQGGTGAAGGSSAGDGGSSGSGSGGTTGGNGGSGASAGVGGAGGSSAGSGGAGGSGTGGTGGTGGTPNDLTECETLVLQSGWIASNSIPVQQCTTGGSMVSLYGLPSGDPKPLSVLATALRPTGILSFASNTHDNAARLDVDKNGDVGRAYGTRNFGWLSLSGAIYHTQRGTPFNYASGWKAYHDTKFEPVTATRVNEVVVIQGMLETDDGTSAGAGAGLLTDLGTVPSGMEPDETRYFAVAGYSGNDRASIVRVSSNGTVGVVGGPSPTYPYVMLSGIAYAQGARKTFTLASGYAAYAGSLIGYRIRDGMVYLHGRIQLPSGTSAIGTAATLPSEAQPPFDVVTEAAAGGEHVRVDVKTNGEIYWQQYSNPSGERWISLDGIHYPAK
ncbi:MAG: hypothetical protein KC766_03065 [Myxococcales bacterium]|nr:hypothetical protein [Myxococcales bacterium]